MRVFLPQPTEDSELCQPVEDADFESFIELVNGVPRAGSWRPIRVELIGEDEGRALSPCDSPWLGEHALIFRIRALDAMRELLEQSGELLPLACADSHLSVFNCTHLLDALDASASDLVRFSSGRVMHIGRYVFRKEVIGDAAVFKIPDLRASPTYLSERFVDAWRAAGLTGLEFQEIWAG